MNTLMDGFKYVCMYAYTYVQVDEWVGEWMNWVDEK